MAEQDVDFFDYVIEEKRPLLLNKIDYIDDTFDDYKKQKAFNKRLLRFLHNHQKLELTTLPSLIHLLNSIGLRVKGYRFFKK